MGSSHGPGTVEEGFFLYMYTGPGKISFENILKMVEKIILKVRDQNQCKKVANADPDPGPISKRIRILNTDFRTYCTVFRIQLLDVREGRNPGDASRVQLPPSTFL